MCVWIRRFVNGMWLGWEQWSTLPASQHGAGRRLVRDRDEGARHGEDAGGGCNWPVGHLNMAAVSGCLP